MNIGTLIISVNHIKGVRAHKIPRFSFSIEERCILGEYVELLRHEIFSFMYPLQSIILEAFFVRKEKLFVSAVI